MQGESGRLHGIRIQKAKCRDSNICPVLFSARYAFPRFSNVMWIMQQILFMSLDKRLALYLLEESTVNNSDTIKATHDQIARHLGSAREVISRMLKYFTAEGIIQSARGEIKILDKSRLELLSK